jgi:hypothetical protein
LKEAWRRFWELMNSKAKNIIISISFLIAILGETVSYNYFGVIFIYFSFFLIITLFFLKKIEESFLLYIILLFNISEFARDISTNIYNLRTVDLYGISIGMFLNILFFVFYVLKELKIKNREYSMKSLILFILIFIYILISIVNMILGNTLLKAFLSDFIYMFSLLSIIVISKNVSSSEKLKYLLFTAIIIRPIIICITIIMNLGEGMYGGLKIYSYDTLDFFISLIPLLIFYLKKIEYPKWLIISSVICSIYVLSIQPSGKTFIIVPLVIFLFFLFSIKKLNPLKSAFFILFLCIILLSSLRIMENSTNQLFHEKFIQFISLTNLTNVISDSSYLMLISESPRIRILETINITGDLTKKFPLEILVGRGFGGSFTDNTIYMNNLNEDAFSREEIHTRNFYGVHTSLNFIFLKFGLIGLLFLGILIVKTLNLGIYMNNAIQKFLLILLICWLFMFIGYSIKLAIFFGVLSSLFFTKNINDKKIRKKESAKMQIEL